MFATLEASSAADGQRNVNIANVPVAKSTEAWTAMLKHLLEDPVLKIYIDSIDLFKEVAMIFRKSIPNREDTIKVIDPLVTVVISKLVSIVG